MKQLTLTRTTTFAITTAGTTIVMESEIRNNGFTWTGSQVTIPDAGYYQVTLLYASTVAHTVQARIFVNTVNVAFMASYGLSSTRQAVTITRYFNSGNIVQINLLPSANTTINVAAEFAVSESPIMHVVQMSGAVT